MVDIYGQFTKICGLLQDGISKVKSPFCTGTGSLRLIDVRSPPPYSSTTRYVRPGDRMVLDR